MAIEGPLRELGIHDVFQLLDLSRKTGTLAVTSELRDNEGTVFFENGRVVAATIKSNPHRIGELLLRSGKVTEGDVIKARSAQSERGDKRRLGEILLDMGAISPKELERQIRLQIEAVVFELLSWREGFFRYEEGDVGERAMIQISTESLLMEGARRIDEWSRIADRVPSLAAIPVLAPVQTDHAPMLDLLPHEWEVLAQIDGTNDLRSLASMISRSEFDVAKIVYGLVSTGVVELKVPGETHQHHATRVLTPILAMRTIPADAAAAPAMLPAAAPPVQRPPVPQEPSRDEPPTQEQVDDLERGYRALKRGDYDGAVKAWAQFLQTHPRHDMSEKVRGGLESAARLRSLMEARYGD